MDFERLTIPRQRIERGLGLSAGRFMRLLQTGLYSDLGTGKGNPRPYRVSEVVSLAGALGLAEMHLPVETVVRIANNRDPYRCGLEGESEMLLATQGRGRLDRVPGPYDGPRVTVPVAPAFKKGIRIVLTHALDADDRAEVELVRAAYGEYINGLRQANPALADAVQAASR